MQSVFLFLLCVWCCFTMAFLITFWRCRRKRRPVALFSALFLCVIFIITYSLFSNFKLDIADDAFLEKSKCPACYGQDLCPEFEGLVKNITIDAYSFRNAKNVYFGKLGDERIVLKKLASDWELDKLDELSCSLRKWLDGLKFFQLATSYVGLAPSVECRWDTARSMWEFISHLQHNQSAVFELAVQYGKTFLAKYDIASDAVQCRSKRFLASVLFNSSYDGSYTNPSFASKLIFLLINPEPIFIQIFNPISSIFPRLLGACGRVVVEEYVGPTIAHFKSSPLYTRLKIAKQLLHLADELTFKRPMGFNFYMTDVTYDNFAIAQNGKDLRVVLIDAEGILVTDPRSLEETSGYSHSPVYANPFGGQNACLQFSAIDLCHHTLADHNFYAVCECLLSDAPCTSEIPGGILWGIPSLIEDRWHVRMLIRICQTGSQDRIKMAKDLMKSISEALKWLETNKLENSTFENS